MKNIARISMLPAAAFCSAARRREVRPAGVREPASPTGSYQRSDPRPGRFRARLFGLLPVLALLVGALFLLTAAPVEAQTKTFSITERARAAEGASASLTITLSEDAPSAGVAFTVTAGFGGSSTAEAADVMSIDSPVTIPSGTRSLSIAIPLTDDDMDEDEETFTVTIATTAEGWMKEGDGKDTAVVSIDDDDNAGVNLIGVSTISNDKGPKIGHLNVYQNTPATYQVVLTSRPVADVTINVSATMWNSVSPASHTFAASSANDWREPKEFTVTAGSRIGSALILHTVTTSDPNYGTLQYSDWSHTSNKLLLDIRPPLPMPTRLTLRADRLPAEGEGAVTVTATLDNPAPWSGTTVRLTLSGTAAGEGTDYTLSSTTISIGAAQTTGTTTITVTDDSADDDDETIVLEASSGNPELTSNKLTLTIEDNDQTAQQQRTEPLTAAFERAPAAHDGTETFRFNVRFSEALGETANAPEVASFAVRGGKVKRVRKVESGLWRVRIAPKSWKDVTVTLAGGRACDEAGAVCTADGRSVSNTSTMTIGGPVRIRVEGARAKEGRDASLDFAVTLNRAAAHEVSVDYETADETATAGADYTAVSGTLTFAAGETAKTVSVPVLDDAIDEGKEVMRLLLSNPQGAFLRGVHTKARGVIRNDDPLQRMWLARFGRAAAGHVAEAIEGRLSDAAAGVVLGGHSLSGGPEREAIESRLAEALLKEREVRLGRGGEAPAPSVREVAMSDLLLASSFHMASAEKVDAGSRWSLWGRGARSSFEGVEGDLSLEGDVTTATVGFDYERARWLVGVALSRSAGDGSYKAGGACDTGCAGEVESTLTGVYPYARYRVSGTFSLWGAVGHGQGEMTLTPGGSSPVEADVAMGMAAAGARGVVLPAREAGGFELALRADVLVTNTRSDAAAGLAETEAQTSRVRLVLEGSRSLRLGEGLLTPSLEIGFRNDSGDAETGGGVEAGGSVRWTSGALTTQVRARGLLSHGEGGYEEWGVSASVAYAPGSGGRGLTLRAGSSWGASTSGAERLWSQAAGLAPAGAFEPGAAGFEAEAAWGLDAPRGLLTPYTGVAVSGNAETWRAGARWKPGAATEVSLEASLTEQAGGGRPEGGLLLRGSKRW